MKQHLKQCQLDERHGTAKLTPSRLRLIKLISDEINRRFVMDTKISLQYLWFLVSL
jgi:predicted transglutaminase-like cysteine proteinase